MKIRILKNSIDSIIISLLLFYVLVGIWIGLGINYLQTLLSLICGIRTLYLLFLKKQYRYCKTLILTLVVMSMYWVFNYFIYGEKIYFIENISYIIKCWVILTYFSVLLTQRYDYDKIIIKLTKFINLYMIINVIILFLQLNETYFLIDISRLPNFVYYPDYIAGLFGINGTHRLTLFSIFHLCLNMYIYRFKLVEGCRYIPKYLCIISLCLCFISTQNDNSTFFFLYPVFVFVMYCCLYKVNYRKITKIFMSVLAVTVVLILVLLNNETLFTEIGKRLGDIIEVYVLGNSEVWDERSELLVLALTHGKGRWFGSGLGSVKMYSDARLSIHWGMNSLMTFVYFMGFIPVLLYAFLHIVVITESLRNITQKTKIAFRILLFALLFMIIQYCQILSEDNLMILFSLTCSVFVLALCRNEGAKK